MVIEELVTKLGFQVDPRGLEKGKSALSSFKKLVGGLAVGAGLFTLSKTGIQAAMAMEGLNSQFTVMTGSADRANSVIQEISEFAAKTPFDKLGLSGAAKTLMAFGLEAESVVPTLKMLGDVAGGDQNKLNSLSLAFGQIHSTGRLTGQDLLQLINQGFNPLTVMAEKSGRSVAELKDMMSQGKISAQDVAKAFQIATSEGGLFFGNLEAQSKTLAGRLATLKDNVVTGLQNMAEAFLPLLKKMADAVIAIDWGPITASVSAFAETLQEIDWDTYLQSLSKVGTLLGFIGNLLGALIGPIVSLITHFDKLLPLLALIFGARLQAMLTRAIVGTRAFAGAQLFVQRAAMSSTGAIYGQINAMGILRSTMYTVGTAAKTVGNSIKSMFLGVGGILTVTLVALQSIKAFRDAEKEELKGMFSQMELDEFEKGNALHKGPEDQLKSYEKTYKEKLKAFKELANDPLATNEQRKKAADDLKTWTKMYSDAKELYKKSRGVEWEDAKLKKGATDGLKQTIQQGQGSVHIANSFDFKLPDSQKGTKTGLGAADVVDIANRAFNAAFNVKLKSLLVGQM